MTDPAYPAARRDDIADQIHGRLVCDPYRWLEDARSAETAAWLAGQDALYADYAAALPGRDRLAAAIGELLRAGEAGVPVWRGERAFFTRRGGGQEHAVLYTEAPGEGTRVLIDPVAINPEGTTTLDGWQPDREGRLLAYQLSEGGSEESVLRVMDVATGEVIDGPISRCRYSQVAWLPGGKAFYYTRRLPPSAVPAGEEQYHRRVYLHRVGCPADDDVLIFGDGGDKTNYYFVSVSQDGRWLAIGASAGTAPRNDLWLADLSASGTSAPELAVVQQGADAQVSCRVGREGRLYLFTDRDAPRGRIAVTDPAGPGPAGWRDLVAEDPVAVLTGYVILDGPELGRPVLVASWTRHAVSEVSVHDLATGARRATVGVPGPGTVLGLSERPEGGHETWIGYTDYQTPPMVLGYDARDGRVSEWARAPGSAEIPRAAARQVGYESADGTTIRMLIITGDDPEAAAEPAASPEPAAAAKPATAAEPAASAVPAAAAEPAAARIPRPAILYGYGGFGISLTPAYSAAILAWVQAGGIYAVAGLRGGSEEGEAWHRAGMRDRKQHVFDDFHAAAAKLVADGWTSRGQLAISGGSNGGLLVGGAITQQPEAWAAAICSAPLLDMVRYEQFGLGETWNDEFGTAADPEELGWLLSYSPYHHVRERTAYPAVLFTVFDGDSRVDPLHARKMCAALQHATSAPFARRPVLLRRERDVGHGARAVSRSGQLSADVLAFAALHTGLSR